jgi:hypothetical protein
LHNLLSFGDWTPGILVLGVTLLVHAKRRFFADGLIDLSLAPVKPYRLVLAHNAKSGAGQCDHIGRIFAQWAIVYFRQFLKITEVAQKFWATLFQSADNVLILTKHGLGNILGDFFTNSSGHPESGLQSG